MISNPKDSSGGTMISRTVVSANSKTLWASSSSTFSNTPLWRPSGGVPTSAFLPNFLRSKSHRFLALVTTRSQVKCTSTQEESHEPKGSNHNDGSAAARRRGHSGAAGRVGPVGRGRRRTTGRCARERRDGEGKGDCR